MPLEISETTVYAHGGGPGIVIDVSSPPTQPTQVERTWRKSHRKSLIYKLNKK